MSRHSPALWLSWALVLVAGPAVAEPVKVHGTLYIKAKNTHLQASPDPAAKPLLILQPGREVTYEGRVPGTPWCKVTVGVADKKGVTSVAGVIFQGNLSTTPPLREVTSKNPLEPLSPEAFASSGAAIKAVGPGTLQYGKTLSKQQSAEELKALVETTNKISDKEVADYALAGGLPLVVGPSENAARSGTRSPVRKEKK